ncbi:MAG: MATE family efflux transporter [Ruminococcaceae bacterium]|nr:MATE family efflux transporter [Oscillospiraceae bacterium]
MNNSRQRLSFSENGKVLTMLSLAVPKFFQQVFQKLLGTANSAMLSHYSGTAVAAVSVSNQVLTVITTLLDALAFGASLLVSLYLGKRDRHTAGVITSVTLFSAFGISLVMGIALSVFAEPILIMMNAEAETLAFSVAHFRIKTALLPITVLGAAVTSLLICNGHAMLSFIFGVGRSVLNVLFTYIILYGGLGVPAVEGIAFSGSLVVFIGLIFEGIFFFRKKCPFVLSFRLSALGNLFRYGVPGKMSTFSYNFAHTITTSFIVALGSAIVTTKVYVTNITGYTSLFSVAIASGGAILVGRFRGAGRMNDIRRLYHRNLALASGLSVAVALVALLLHRPLMNIFTKDEAAITLARNILFIDIFVELFRAVNMVSDQSLNACGHVKTTLAASAISCWLFSVGVAYVFSACFNWGLAGIWLAFMADEMARAIFYLFYWRRLNKKLENKIYSQKEIIEGSKRCM